MSNVLKVAPWSTTTVTHQPTIYMMTQSAQNTQNMVQYTHTHTAMQQVRHYQSINSATVIKILNYSRTQLVNLKGDLHKWYDLKNQLQTHNKLMIFYKVTHCVSMGMSSTSARETPSFSNIAATSTENAIQLINLFFFITLSHGRYGERESYLKVLFWAAVRCSQHLCICYCTCKMWCAHSTWVKYCFTEIHVIII